jgi:hypothetical protein
MTDALPDELLAWFGAMDIGHILPGCMRTAGVSADGRDHVRERAGSSHRTASARW